MDKLLAGASAEEIKVVETAVKNAQIAFSNIQVNLTDTEKKAQQDLAIVYQDALNILDDVYLTSYNVLQDVIILEVNYLLGPDQDSVKIQKKRSVIQRAIVKENSLS